MTLRTKRIASTALALVMAAGLSACTTPGGGMTNTSLNSVNQPVVQRHNYTLDLRADSTGLSVPEMSRLAGWFEAMDLGYGDRISIDDPMASAAVTEDVSAVASRYGLLIEDTAPVTVGFVDPGHVRVVVTRSTAHVPNCPNWSGNSNGNLANATSAGFGCAVNSNFAAMVADPQHLLEGAAGSGETVVMSSTKAIESYRNTPNTGAGGLPDVSSTEGS
jgi:pilus assembly protein CpaD